MQMEETLSLQERCRKILEDNGGMIADKARTILVEEPGLKGLATPLEFVSKNWRNPLTPAIMRLSCEAVGGQPEETNDAALSMTLMSLSFYVWDDIIDRASSKLFKPTLFGKFGEGTALIIGGLALAKAFSIVNKMRIGKEKYQVINEMFWTLWVNTAQTETISLRLRNQRKTSSIQKFSKIKKEAAIDLGTCVRIGALIGNGSDKEATHLTTYGICLGIILELWKDFHVSVNLTLELADKIRNGAPPFSLLWAMERSEKIRKDSCELINKKNPDSSEIKEIVDGILEAGAVNNTLRAIQRYVKRANKALLEMKGNYAVRALQVLIEAQPRLFVESLPALETQRI